LPPPYQRSHHAPYILATPENHATKARAGIADRPAGCAFSHEEMAGDWAGNRSLRGWDEEERGK